MPNIGVPELLIVLAVLLLVFGPKRLPGLGRQLGSGLREFKESVTGGRSDDDDEDDTRGQSAATGLPAASPQDALPADDAARAAEAVRERRV